MIGRRPKQLGAFLGDQQDQTAFGSLGPEPRPPPGRARAALNIKWSAASLSGREGLRLVFALALARLIGPHNYGIVGLGLIYIAFLEVFLEQGFLATLIQRPDLSSKETGTVFVASLVTSVLAAAFTFFAAPVVARFFQTPQLTAVLRILAFTLVLRGLAIVPQALVMRGMTFRLLAVAEITAALSGGVSGVVTATLGGAYWSLVVQAIVFDAVVLGVLVAARGLPRPKFSWQALREMWVFSIRMLGGSLFSYGSRNADNFLIGRVLGATQLGYYALAYRVMMLPVQNLGIAITRVALPSFSLLQNDRARLRGQVLAGTRLVALAAAPLAGAVVALAPIAIPSLFGPSWRPAVLPMQILAITGFMQATLALLPQIIIACGRPGLYLRYALLNGIVIVGSFVAGLPWGVTGVAAAYTAANLLLAPVLVIVAGRLVGLELRAHALSMWRPVASASASGLIAAGLGFGLARAGVPDGFAFLAGLVGLGGAYGGLMWRFSPDLVAEAVGLVRMARGTSLLAPH